MTILPRYVIGIDLGTSACKTVLFELNGRKVSDVSMEYPIHHPREGWVEQNPLDWWNAVVMTMRGSLEKARLSKEDIVGLSVDSQREAIVPIGKGGEELYNSLIWLDRRTGPQLEFIKRKLSEETVLSLTGLLIDPIFSASKILWFKDNLPEIFSKTACFLCAKDYVIYKLTGEFVTDYSMASRTMLFDIRKRRWSDELCDSLGIPMDKLPNAGESYEVVGEISSLTSSLTGLAKGTPVVNGGGDRPCECLGAGVMKEGQVNIGTGTGSVIEVPIRRPSIDVKGRINCCCHVIPDMWEYEAIVSTTGACLRWFRDVFGWEEETEAQRSNRDVYDLLIDMASEVGPGADGLFFYPHLAGMFSPKFDQRARGVYFGITLSHMKQHFVRAILEGIAFQYLEFFELLKEMGIEVKEVSMVGGETKSELWNKIKSDVLGMRIRIPIVENSAAWGAALLAVVGTRQYSSLEKAVEQTIKAFRLYEPDTKVHETYSKVYEKYKAVFSFISKAYEIS